MMVVVLAVLVAVGVILVGGLLLCSPGRIEPLVDENGNAPVGGISEKIRVEINGIQQGMFIRSADQTSPVLLFLHGGPGMPEFFLTQHYPTGLERIFTVCWWEQRGSGLSYHPDMQPEKLTIEDLISDTLEVTKYLQRRFGKEKIYLMGHSGGSFIGIQAAARAPELYHAYIGMGQITYQLKSERLAYAFMLEQFKANGNVRMVSKLEKAPVAMQVPLHLTYDAVRDEAMHGLGIGTTHKMRSVVSGIFLPVMQCRAYTLSEKINIWRGKFFSRKVLWNVMLATDLTQQVCSLAIPIYFCQGIFDYTTSYAEAKSFFTGLEAPLKGFYTFEQSAHSPLFEEPDRMLKILQEDVLRGEASLADSE